MFSLLAFKTKAAALGAFALIAISFFVRLKIVSSQRDKARSLALELKRRNNSIVEQKKLKRKEEKKLLKELKKINEELEKEGEDFDGLDNFNAPNDF